MKTVSPLALRMLKEKKRVSKGESAFFIGSCCFFRGVFSL